jgi:hypothetical protein
MQGLTVQALPHTLGLPRQPDLCDRLASGVT